MLMLTDTATGRRLDFRGPYLDHPQNDPLPLSRNPNLPTHHLSLQPVRL